MVFKHDKQSNKLSFQIELLNKFISLIFVRHNLLQIFFHLWFCIKGKSSQRRKKRKKEDGKNNFKVYRDKKRIFRRDFNSIFVEVLKWLNSSFYSMFSCFHLAGMYWKGLEMAVLSVFYGLD